MPSLSDAINGFAGAVNAFVASNRASDYLVQRKMVPALRKFIHSKKQFSVSMTPAEQTKHLAEFFKQPEGLKYLAHYRKSSYNSVAGTAKLLYQILSYV